MASEYTPNFNLDLYVAEDKPNLLDQYNAAMNKVDSAIKARADENTNNSSSIITINSQIGEIDGQINGLGTRMDGIDTQIEGLGTRMDGIDTQIEGLGTRMDGIDTQIEGIDDQLSDVDTALEGKEPKVHASTGTAYGVADANLYGHVKLVDTIGDSPSGAAAAIAASPLAVKRAIDTSPISSNPMSFFKRGSSMKVVTIGDSYGVSTSSTTSPWPLQIASIMGWDVANYSEGGGGFITPSNTSSRTFQQWVTYAASNIEADHGISPSDVDMVIVAGGRNDQGAFSTQGQNGIRTGVLGVCTTVRSSFPNALLVIVPMLWDYKHFEAANLRLKNALELACLCYAGSLQNFGRTVIGGWTWGIPLGSSFFPDGTHPNNDASAVYANFIISGIIGNPVQYRNHMETSGAMNFGLTNGIWWMQGSVSTSSPTTVPSWWVPSAIDNFFDHCVCTDGGDAVYTIGSGEISKYSGSGTGSMIIFKSLGELC